MRHICRFKVISKLRGFTLVEIVVVAPLVILLIGAAIAVTINASTSALRAAATSQLQNDILTALDMIEQDVTMSLRISASSSSQIAMNSLATTKNPLDPTRQLIKMPGCTVAPTGIAREEALTFIRTYRISDNTLIRRTDFGGTTCSIAWQKDQEEQVIHDATLDMSLMYEGVSDGSARAVHITLTGTRTVAGQDVSYTGVMYVRSADF